MIKYRGGDYKIKSDLHGFRLFDAIEEIIDIIEDSIVDSIADTTVDIIADTIVDIIAYTIV